MIKITSKGSYKKTLDKLIALQEGKQFDALAPLAQAGVSALAGATPFDSGLTAASWTSVMFKKGGKTGVAWYNTHVVNGVPIAVILDVGHGTGTGGWVPGRHFITPAINPIMDRIEDEVWKKVIE